jgi:hypothetical protein
LGKNKATCGVTLTHKLEFQDIERLSLSPEDLPPIVVPLVKIAVSITSGAGGKRVARNY